MSLGKSFVGPGSGSALLVAGGEQACWGMQPPWEGAVFHPHLLGAWTQTGGKGLAHGRKNPDGPL